MSQNTPIERMKKILALARRGVDGEKDTAEAMLAKLLAKYKMTIEDLEGEEQPTAKHSFEYEDETERLLLVQIVANIIGRTSVAHWKLKRKKVLLFMLTALQHAEVDVRYTAYRAALKQELEKATKRIYSAFIHTNGLGVAPTDDAERPELTEADQEELAAIRAMMRAMKPTPVHRQLESAA